MNFSVLYRGQLSSCNYSCSYCPFAKRMESKSRLEKDRSGLADFATWIAAQTQHRWKVLFTPWGEALVRRWYRATIAELTHYEHLDTVAVQTNLSCSLNWLRDCRVDRLALWATYHPSEVTADTFLNQVQRLRTAGARVSVGMVGVPDSLAEARSMRQQLPPDVYLWINAQQPRRRPYTPDELAGFTSIDPQFALTARRQPSLGGPCRTGEVSFTVDGTGSMRRCHFVNDIIGSIHDSSWEESLRPRPCPNRFCDCFLGKAQLQAEDLFPFFGESILERIADSTVLAELPLSH